MVRRWSALVVGVVCAALAGEGTAQGGWLQTGSLKEGRGIHTATLLPSGKVLVAGGANVGGLVSGTELYDPATGAWKAAGALRFPRWGHTATLLPSGKVLVTGGRDEDFAPLASTELYDPITKTWSPAGSLLLARYQHTATLLPSGKILVAGGNNANDFVSLASAELFDPATGTWSSAGSLQVARSRHTATLLQTGEVLAVGGNSSAISSEIYDPAANVWRLTSNTLEDRLGHTATLLPSGKVLVAGGTTFGSLAKAGVELFDPINETWEAAAPLNRARRGHNATLLPSGEVLVVGSGSELSTEIYNPQDNSWVEAGDLLFPFVTTATLLASGGVLATGDGISSTGIYHPSGSGCQSIGSPPEGPHGQGVVLLPSGQVLFTASGQLYDEASSSWEATGTPITVRSEQVTVLLSSGMILLAGGNVRLPDGSQLWGTDSAELYNPESHSWEATGSLNTGRSLASGTRLSDGRILVAGGVGNSLFLASAELYDPETRLWEVTAPLKTHRHSHTATLLHSGKVLVAGGVDINYGSLASAELYDPATGTWEPTGDLFRPRAFHSATLLPSGKVLVVGGERPAWTSAELYDPITGTWTMVAPPIIPRELHTATLLPSGRVYVASLTSAESYDPTTGIWEMMPPLTTSRQDHEAILLNSGRVLLAGGSAEICEIIPVSEERRPVITSAMPQIDYGVPFSLTGRFRGDSEANSGDTQSSAVNFPVLFLRSLDGSQQAWLSPDPRPNFWDDPMTLTVSDLPPTLHPGPHLLSVVVAGVPSSSVPVDLSCSLVITRHPSSQIDALGSTVTFQVESQGGRLYQWRKDGVDIPGATASSYTTPLVSPGDSGTAYTVEVGTGCMTEVSEAAVLTVADSTAPGAAVISPSGGEYWLLSQSGATNTEVVTWSMSDNIRICRVEARLLFSNDGGQTYQPVPDPTGGMLLTAGPGGTCRFGEQPSVTSLSYDVPASPPSGTAGSLYKIEVRATDHAGLTTTARSANPFFIVQPNPDTVRTLILSNLQRMRTVQGFSQEQADVLATKLRDLASHPRVQGLVVDLASVTSLAPFYESWDAELANPDRANALLFAPGGLHDYLRSELLPTYTGVRHLIVVGDDRIIPFARVPDQTGLRESAYVAGGDLTAVGTVGAALAADRYLSDDLLATKEPVTIPFTADQRDRGVFLPDFAVGRLVENPEEIVTTIATFISQDGVLDLQALHPSTGHKVLVTGYDFLIDSGRRIRRRWKDALRLPLPHDDGALEPVDGRLLTLDWGEATVASRRNVLRQHLAGNGGNRYGIANLNGHANHHQEGVPGAGVTDIQGLGSTEIFGPSVCGGGSALTLGGSVVYSSGCHGGLPVAGSCSTDVDHSLDLPQAFLARGAQAYVANTGYGWGLKEGVGYGERLVEIFTEELTAGGTIAVGDAVLRAKQRYFLELPRFDDYDEKTLLQWSLFGLPMYAIRTGIVSVPGATSVSAQALESRRGTPVTGQVGPVKVESHVEAAVALPSHLIQLNAHFDFSAPGVYTKYNAFGDPLPEGTVGCPDPAPGKPAGCYYTLNNLAGGGTGSSDLPIQPYFLYDSRLSGTSQHGALWTGGTYVEEGGWEPVIAELISNGGDFSNNGSTPWIVKPKPRPIRRPTGDDELTCRPSDLEPSTLVVVTGESLKAGDSDPSYSRQRIYRGLDLEVLYFNDRGLGGNCDRSGPELGPPIFNGAYHQLSGGKIDWAVPASDEAGVWRVVVVYDLGPKGDGQGEWRPVELTADGSGIWRGSLTTAGVSRLTYFLQAVDRRGNVSWLDFDTVDLPASGVPHDLPLAVDVIVPNVSCYPLSLARHPSSGGGLPSASPPNSSGCVTGHYLAGAPITVTGSPNADWSVGSWSGTDNNASPSTTNSVTMPVGSHTVTVNYIQPVSPLPGLGFYTVAPCRLVDTRQAPEPLTSGVTRTFSVIGACGIPPGARAVSLNVTAVGAGVAGFITLFPSDQSPPATSTISFQAGQTRANNAVLGLSSTGHLAALATLAGGSVHLILDVNGYFAEDQP